MMYTIICKYKYLSIPHNFNDVPSDYNLKTIMEEIAFINGRQKAKIYFSKKLGCPRNVIKSAIKSVPCPRAIRLNIDAYPSKDSYSYIKKINIEFYSRILKLIIDEFPKVRTDILVSQLIESVRELKKDIYTYLDVFGYQSKESLDRMTYDILTANKINRIDNCMEIVNQLLIQLNEIEIKLL